MKSRTFWICLISLTVLITVPFIIASAAGGANYKFGGFLLNPLDGNSYLAKMEEGRLGSWSFNLLYSPHSSSGAYIFLFYIFLGYLSRWTSVPNILIFHIIRVLAAWFLLFEMKKFLDSVFQNDEKKSNSALIWITFGGGLGWLLLFFGVQTADFWVAEGYPFLASFVNPHFPLALALMLLTLRIANNSYQFSKLIFTLLLGIALGIMLPFGVVIVGLISLASVIWSWINEKRLHPWYLVAFGAGGLPFLIYELMVVKTNPELMIWNQQNITTAPKIWDFLLSLSPAIVFAIIGLVLLVRTKQLTTFKIPVIWFAVGTILTYFPFSLQRRFMLGIYIPTVILAIIGIFYFLKSEKPVKQLKNLSIGFSFITPVLVILIGLTGAFTHSSMLYLSRDEANGLGWLQQNGEKGTVVLADSRLGMFIPGATGLRVIYGHPFESIDAEEQKLLVEDFFSGKLTRDQEQQLVQDNDVTYIIFEGSESSTIAELRGMNFIKIQMFGELTIYQYSP